jgi:alpha/beta superfamily hydrolase
MTAVTRYVVFSHGKDSEPWGRKISLLAETARAEGYAVDSVDYRGIDDPLTRVARLVEACQGLAGDLVLVGSSLGGYVSLAAAALLHARGVFLMAPAIYFDGLPPLRPRPLDCPATIVHAWQDEVVPCDHSVRFGREHGVTLHLINGDHRMHGQLRTIQHLFEHFIIALDLPESG